MPVLVALIYKMLQKMKKNAPENLVRHVDLMDWPLD